VELSGKRILVVGLGKSGRAASFKLKAMGAQVRASDALETEEMMSLAGELASSGIDVKLGKQEEDLLDSIDMVVVSPGVPSRISLVGSAKSRGIPVWSEIELAFRLTDKPIVAITGTNGKTTTTTLIGKVFEEAGLQPAIAGNIGTPLVSAIAEDGFDRLVVEISSFQLDNIVDFRPKVAVLLNITEDHLDWHPDFDDYVRAKSRLFINQESGDFAVLNVDDEVVRSLAPDIKATIIKTSKQELEQGVFIRDSRIVAKLKGIVDGIGEAEIDICGINETKIRGNHNLDNVMAVVGACLASGVDVGTIKEVLTSFTGLPHRIEYIARVNGVLYFDDSKATNVDATVKALTAFNEPIVLLVGGRNKGNDFGPLAQSIDKQVTAVIGFGEAGREILSSMPADTLQEYAETVDGAVLLASKIAEPGQVVLFSPSCASFDAFTSYAQRGEAFKKAVLALGERNGERET